MTQCPHSLGTRRFLKQLGAAIVLSMIGLGPAVCAVDLPAQVNKPNSLFIFSDDLSYRDLSCYGQTDVQGAHVAAKRRESQAESQMQNSVKANTLYKGRSDDE